jgi:hypothetical protein
MWFLLRMTFSLAVVLVLLPTGGSQTAPKSEVSAGEGFSAARGAVTNFEHLREAAGSLRSRIADGPHAWPSARAGAKMLYEFLGERLGYESKSVRTLFPFLSPDRICELLASEPT